jgi:hypothetical protein
MDDIKCEGCGKSADKDNVEIGDYLQHGILCEGCAEEIVPKSFYKLP